MMEYNGNELDQKTLDTLLKTAEELNVPPSYLITKLHYEGLWGDSAVAKENNNLSGMTWTGNSKRPSGVVVEKGSARPAREGGHYMKYKSIEDFMKDWTYLIRRGGIYKVADSETFDDAVKGMFKVGGAKYDYATMNVQDGKQRYELYLQGMKARRQAINNANDKILDELDGGKSEVATATKVLNIAKGLIGTRQRSASHQKLVNEYNSIRPNLRRPNGGQYTAKLSDDWCDIFVTVVFKRAGALNLIDAECGVQHHMNHMKKKGIWVGRVKPRPGDIVIFDWHGYRSGWADHIGIVERLSGNTVHTIEGNVGSAPRSVARRTHAYNGNTIVGYARPKYSASTGGGGSTSTSSSTTSARARGKSTQTIAAEVLAGVWGNGDARKKALQSHGYNYSNVQAQVNKLFGLKGKSNTVLAKHVIDGDFSTNPVRQKALKAIGANASAVQKEVNRLITQPTPKKSVREVAQEIVDGKGGWGNNPEREQKLKAQGYDPKKVQAEVNKIMKENTPQRKTIKQVAQEIVEGKGGWGTNPTRAKKLTDAGYNAQEVQAEVNKIMRAQTPEAPREEIVEAPKEEQTGNTPTGDKLADNEVILDGVRYIIKKSR